MIHLGYILLLIVVVTIINSYYIKIIKGLKEKNFDLLEIKTTYINYVKKLKDEKAEINKTIDTRNCQIDLLNNFIINLINNKLFVYTQSKFYHNYSVYNNRFYAKIDRNIKAEAIPLLKADDMGNVYDIYGIVHDIALLDKNQRRDIKLISIINANTVRKVTLKNNLENKVLKTYKRGQILK